MQRNLLLSWILYWHSIPEYIKLYMSPTLAKQTVAKVFLARGRCGRNNKAVFNILHYIVYQHVVLRWASRSTQHAANITGLDAQL